MIQNVSDNIAAYVRISVDLDLTGENTSIENQKAIIEAYVQRHYPNKNVVFFEDRDKSGYTFAQRDGYQELRRALEQNKFGTVIFKDFSRFSRRNSLGLVELETLRDMGVRIIAIDDNVIYPDNDQWFQIQIRFLMNEIPVTDTSRKVRSVVKNRQEKGEWVCNVPYGFRMVNTKKMIYEAVPEEVAIIQRIFRMYVEDELGYKKIAIILTDEKIPTPRQSEKYRREAAGEDYNVSSTGKWSHVTISGILKNDFYIGTLRQHKYARRTINGDDVKTAEEDEIVIENRHPAIIEHRIFAAAQSAHKRRTTSHYRGKKKNENIYSGFLYCGECGRPLSTMSRGNSKESYQCSTYSKYGKAHCSNHYVKGAQIDAFMLNYLQMLQETSADMLDRLQKSIQSEKKHTGLHEGAIVNLEKQLADAQGKLKALITQKARDAAKGLFDDATLDETYDALIQEAGAQIKSVQAQIAQTHNRRNDIIRLNRAAKVVMDIFAKMLEKGSLDRIDLELLVEKIVVYQDIETEDGKAANYKHFEISLKPDIDSILLSGVLPDTMEEAVNFNLGIVDSLKTRIVHKIPKHKDEVYDVNVVREGDPLEIYTEKDGGVIFRKYSPMGDLQDFAAQICESIGANTGYIAAVSDRDSVIALSGAPKRELLDKTNSQELSKLMEQRKNYRFQSGQTPIRVSEGVDKYHLGVAAPIVSQGDLMGCMMLLLGEGASPLEEADQTLVQTMASFLGKQMES